MNFELTESKNKNNVTSILILLITHDIDINMMFTGYKLKSTWYYIDELVVPTRRSKLCAYENHVYTSLMNSIIKIIFRDTRLD